MSACEYEHVDTEITYEGFDGIQWMCRVCGAEGWEDPDDDAPVANLSE
jgi:hypothetical protein